MASGRWRLARILEDSDFYNTGDEEDEFSEFLSHACFEDHEEAEVWPTKEIQLNNSI